MTGICKDKCCDPLRFMCEAGHETDYNSEWNFCTLCDCKFGIFFKYCPCCGTKLIRLVDFVRTRLKLAKEKKLTVNVEIESKLQPGKMLYQFPESELDNIVNMMNRLRVELNGADE